MITCLMRIGEFEAFGCLGVVLALLAFSNFGLFFCFSYKGIFVCFFFIREY